MHAFLTKCLRHLLWRYPLLSGHGSLIQIPPIRYLQFPKSVCFTKLRNGLDIAVFPDDFIGRCAYLFGDVDPKITLALRALLNSGDTLVDVGANVGVVAFQCLAYVGATGRIVAVEPQPTCCDALTQTITRHTLANVEVHQIALSDKNGQLPLFQRDESNMGMSTLEPQVRAMPECHVRVENASDFLATLSLGNNTSYVLKIDVEGHEKSVLRGMADYFATHMPKAILFESHNLKNESLPDGEASEFHILSDLGFEVYELPKALMRLRLNRVILDGPRPTGTDFLAVPPEICSATLRERFQAIGRVLVT